MCGSVCYRAFVDGMNNKASGIEEVRVQALRFRSAIAGARGGMVPAGRAAAGLGACVVGKGPFAGTIHVALSSVSVSERGAGTGRRRSLRSARRALVRGFVDATVPAARAHRKIDT